MSCFNNQSDACAVIMRQFLVYCTFVFLVANTEGANIFVAEFDSNADVERIVGGKESSIEAHPYQVSFLVNNSSFCGGFIASENYIITAAHCVDNNVTASSVVLRAGSSYWKNGTIIPIAEVIGNPEYDTPKFDKDVAVMKTAEPIQFNAKIQPIALPPRGRPMVGGTKVVVSGWGLTETGSSSIPDRLRDVEIPVINQTRCVRMYPDIITGNMWCGGDTMIGGKGTCGGDSGGPAVQDKMAVGIVSFGPRPCRRPRSPYVFADVAAPYIRDFITKHTGL